MFFFFSFRTNTPFVCIPPVFQNIWYSNQIVQLKLKLYELLEIIQYVTSFQDYLHHDTTLHYGSPPYSYHERNMFTYLTLQLVVKKHCNKTWLSVVGRELLVTYNTRGTIDHLWNKLIIRWVYSQKKKHTHCNNITQTRYFKISSRQKQHCERGGTKQWRQAPFLANDKHAHDKCSRAYSPD